jgi:radical SAM family uncharacterized protein/radical SAM-linked protein
MKYTPVSFRHFLSAVEKPARYCDNEINAFQKIPSAETVNFCLAFPDVYEVGFSHLGIKILYSILNREADAVADRVYAPWPDFAQVMQDNKLPLFGIESAIPLADFDVVGFTMQSELTFTNVLDMLHMAGIPLFSGERDASDPIILAGGPAISNPESMADFLDAVVIGDGEEVIIEIKNALRSIDRDDRSAKLAALAALDGVYVPALHHSGMQVRKRVCTDLDNPDKQHSDQLVPWLQPTHDRYVAEIMRGCSRGCRFCHAGYFYRPVRERDPQRLVDTILQQLDEQGWEEVALTSLSSSDYTCIKPLLMELYSRLNQSKASLSLPSLRVDTIDDDLTRLMNALRQSGLTVAPEAGSQRLRNVINKNLSEEEILNSVEIARKNGWQLIKLYFMIGLPYEEESDVQAIVELVEKMVAMSGKRLRINITVSPFVPKPFTPFQWAAMDDRQTLLSKAMLVKNGLKQYKFIKVKYHEIETSMLECVIGRGDRRVGRLIHRAWMAGARFDGWNEYFRFEYWQQAAQQIGLDFADYTAAKALDQPLPWDHISLGIDREFLAQENRKAQAEAVTSDCRRTCTMCGVCDGEVIPHYSEGLDLPDDIQIEPELNQQQQLYYYRVYYQKPESMKYVAYLDLLRSIQRILRRSGLPIAFTEGFNVHPRVSFGNPLSIGISGEEEFFDLVLTASRHARTVEEAMQTAMPPQLPLLRVDQLHTKQDRSLGKFTQEDIAMYPPKSQLDAVKAKVDEFNAASQWLYTRIRKKRERTADLKELVPLCRWEGDHVHIVKSIVGASLFDIMREVFGVEREVTGDFTLIRKKIL